MYRWIEHTSEVELEVTAESERAVYADALSALAELLGFDQTEAPTPAEHRTVTVSAEGSPDRALLLAGWLEELAFLAESEGFVALRLTALERRASQLVGEVEGVLGDPPPLVKAVTLHRLAFAPDGSGYRARVVLDV